MKQAFGSSHIPLPPAVRGGDFVYVSGQVPVRLDGTPGAGGVAEQTEQVLLNVRDALELAGARLEGVVKATVILQDARDSGAMNAVYARHYPEAPPARTTLEAQLVIDVRVEIDAVAFAPPGR